LRHAGVSYSRKVNEIQNNTTEQKRGQDTKFYLKAQALWQHILSD